MADFFGRHECANIYEDLLGMGIECRVCPDGSLGLCMEVSISLLLLFILPAMPLLSQLFFTQATQATL